MGLADPEFPAAAVAVASLCVPPLTPTPILPPVAAPVPSRVAFSVVVVAVMLTDVLPLVAVTIIPSTNLSQLRYQATA
jgi:hypothetical protein